MSEAPRLRRRIAGAFIAREAELGLATVPEPRKPRGLRCKSLPSLLRMCVLALMAGCKGFRQLESLSAEMSVAWRRRLKIRRRLPDTTMRTTICKLEPEPLRDCLRAQVKAAHRRQALAPAWGLPFGAVSIDGKHTAIGAWDELYAQKQEHSSAVGVSGVVRTMTCCLISSRAKVCIDASPIPSARSEMAHYPNVLQELNGAYGALNLFRVVTSDAGVASEANARLTVKQYRKDYLFRLNAKQPTLYRDARKLLGRRRPEQC